MTKIVKLPNELAFELVDDALSRGEEVTLRVRGNSMRPTLRHDRDCVRLVSGVNYDVGSVVLARVAGIGHVLHRVVAIDGERVTLCGDGNLRGVERCRCDDVVAVAVGMTHDDGPLCRVPQARLWRMLPRLARRVLLHFMR